MELLIRQYKHGYFTVVTYLLIRLSRSTDLKEPKTH